jgi:hypothetical protein
MEGSIERFDAVITISIAWRELQVQSLSCEGAVSQT